MKANRKKLTEQENAQLLDQIFVTVETDCDGESSRNTFDNIKDAADCFSPDKVIVATYKLVKLQRVCLVRVPKLEEEPL